MTRTERTVGSLDEDELCSDCGEILDDPRTHCEECGACAGAFHGYGCTAETDDENEEEGE